MRKTILLHLSDRIIKHSFGKVLTILLISGTINAHAKDFIINVQQLPLNVLFEQLRNEQGFDFSYNNNDLSDYRITLNENFASKEEAVAALLVDLPFHYDYMNGVFIIYPEPKQHEVKALKVFYLSGRLLDNTNREPLPYSHLQINSHSFIANENGYFSYKSETDSLFDFRASHLGFNVLDTVLMACANCNLILRVEPVELSSVKIKKYVLETASLTGTEAGHIKLNQAIVNHLPGQSDNSLYSVLRLQPGILAAGEQSNDLIIWGCSEGEAQVFYDKIPIWNLRNFHDNIGIINPLMIKNLEVYKAGYNATRQDKVGGIVEIAGKDGVMPRFKMDVLISNFLANAMVEAPVTHNSSLKLAYRRTYYNLFDKSAETQVPSQGNRNNFIDLQIVPDYAFNDFNLKYTGHFNNGDYYYISGLLAKDNFYYSVTNSERLHVDQTGSEENYRLGMSGFYEKTWANGNASSLTLHRSRLNGVSAISRTVKGQYRRRLINQTQISNDDDIVETGIEFEHSLNIAKNINTKAGVKYIDDRTNMQQDTMGLSHYEIASQSRRIATFINNWFNITNKLTLQVGGRLNYLLTQNKAYFSPRFSVTSKPLENWRFNVSLGKYHQFVTRSVVEDEASNYHYVIICADGDSIPVLKSYHAVGNIAFSKNRTHINIESYFKFTDGTTSYQYTPQLGNVFTGQSRSYGAELLIKQNINSHMVWASYNLGKVVERYPDFRNPEYERAPYDQRHELKFGAIASYKRFYLSGNYIFGSGLPVYERYNGQVIDEEAYHRADLSAAYKFNRKSFSGELGISVLNVTNYENLRITDSEVLPDENLVSAVNIYTEPMPRTFTVFLKVGL